ncbi:MAG: AAA family ATPase [Betaproteobacteria bacterium]|nr:AAA family ATPase [Betaproteobacteria bacterium]
MAVFPRLCEPHLARLLASSPAVLLTGARQTGKSFLARKIAGQMPSVVYDLEDPDELAKLAKPGRELRRHPGKLIVIDEVQHKPDIFKLLRVLIDEDRRAGSALGRFLLLGSVTGGLQNQTESLAGRIMKARIHPLSLLELVANGSPDSLFAGIDPREIPAGNPIVRAMHFLRQRGGYPGSLLATDDGQSRLWRENYLDDVIGSDTLGAGSKLPAAKFAPLLRLIADGQGSVATIQAFAGPLQLRHSIVNAMLAVLEEMMIVIRLPALSANIKQQIRKGSKYYIADSGLHSVLAGESGRQDWHSWRGANWEGFVIQNVVATAPAGWRCFYFQASRTPEIDLVISKDDREIWAVEIKSADHADPARLARTAALIGAQRSFVVSPDAAGSSHPSGVRTISLFDLLNEMRSRIPESAVAPPAAPGARLASAQYLQVMQALDRSLPEVGLRRREFIAATGQRLAAICRQATGAADREGLRNWKSCRDELLAWLDCESARQPTGAAAKLWRSPFYRLAGELASLRNASGRVNQAGYSFAGDFAGLCCHDLFVHAVALLIGNDCHEEVHRLLEHRYPVGDRMLAFMCFWAANPVGGSAASPITVAEFVSAKPRHNPAALIEAELLLFVFGALLSDKPAANEREGRLAPGYLCWDPHTFNAATTIPPLPFFRACQSRAGIENLLACLGIEVQAANVASLKETVGKYLHKRSDYLVHSPAIACQSMHLENWHDLS